MLSLASANSVRQKMESDKHAATCAILSTVLTIRKRRRRRKDREVLVWMHDWLKKRSSFGANNCLISEFRASDHSQFNNFMRMNAETFDALHNLIAPIITKKDMNFRLSVPASDRLAVTLRFLATGKVLITLNAYMYKIKLQYVSTLVCMEYTGCKKSMYDLEM